jgi:hypothetical protein
LTSYDIIRVGFDSFPDSSSRQEVLFYHSISNSISIPLAQLQTKKAVIAHMNISVIRLTGKGCSVMFVLRPSESPGRGGMANDKSQITNKHQYSNTKSLNRLTI